MGGWILAILIGGGLLAGDLAERGELTSPRGILTMGGMIAVFVVVIAIQRYSERNRWRGSGDIGDNAATGSWGWFADGTHHDTDHHHGAEGGGHGSSHDGGGHGGGDSGGGHSH